LFERVVSLEVQKAYERLRSILFRNNCKIIAEEPTNNITVEHGSLWRHTPKGAEKKIVFHLFPHNSGTRITGTTSLTSDWINVNILGYVLCIIIALSYGFSSKILLALIDLQQKLLPHSPPSYSEILLAQIFLIISISLVIFMIIGIILDVYIYIKKDSFPEEILRLLP